MDGDGKAGRWVFGLCAQWCGVCRDWRAVFDACAAVHAHDRFVWVDVEDQDKLMGELDVETFPTLLVGNPDGVLFFGPVLPSQALLTRLLGSLDDSVNAMQTAQAQALLQRLIAAQL